MAWSSDGSRLLYSDDGKLYVTDAGGSSPLAVDTGCSSPCWGDSQVAFSRDGRSIAFVRGSQNGSTQIATMDLATGRVSELSSTASDATAAPRWSPDGKQIVFFRYGDKDTGGPVPPRLSAVWVVDADGENLRQVSPTALPAQNPDWSPDGVAHPVPVAERRRAGHLHDAARRDRCPPADLGWELGLGGLDAGRTDPVRPRRGRCRRRGPGLVDDGWRRDACRAPHRSQGAECGRAVRQPVWQPIRRVRDRAPAVDGHDRDRGRTACAHAISDADTLPGSGLRLDRHDDDR